MAVVDNGAPQAVMLAELTGGPQDGHRVTVGAGSTRINGEYRWPIRWPAPKPKRPKWWRSPRGWWTWRKIPDPVVPPIRSDLLTWSRTPQVRDGAVVFALDPGCWSPYRVDADMTVLVHGQTPALLAVCATMYCRAHPDIRNDPRTRIVISHRHYMQLKYETAQRRLIPEWPPKFVETGADPPPEPPPYLLGVQVEVDDACEAPYLINPKYPAGWPG